MSRMTGMNIWEADGGFYGLTLRPLGIVAHAATVVGLTLDDIAALGRACEDVIEAAQVKEESK